ncbi:MAG TPA: glutamate--tRNA ligase [Phycisphaerales bacterium]|nr:glutamate--tRNA ligase [Phycisphaerales bacterium]
MTTITRFAPSPTGHLHVGGARTAMFCWAFARATGGGFLLRIEDTDAARSSDESARGIMEDMAWLGIAWDEGPELDVGQASRLPTATPSLREPGGRPEARLTNAIGGDPRRVGPFFQARRLDLYNKYIERLVRAGRAYPAFETSDELDAKRKAATARKETYRFERPADVREGEFNEARWERACAGETHVVRFLALREGITVQDQILGDVKTAPGELDDFVVRKADGLPTYHFAVVVDDETMGVTHVLRAQEHLTNTPRHVALQKALGFRTPAYAHLPLIFNVDGTKMSKRDKAKSARKAMKDRLAAPGAPNLADAARAMGVDEPALAAFLNADNDALDTAEAIARHLRVALPEIEVADFREAGYAPEPLCNYLALLGWNPGMKLPDGKDLEKFDLAFLAQHFSLDRVGRTPSKFDRKKLLSFNADFLAALPADEFAARWSEWLRAYEPGAWTTLSARGIAGSPRFALLARAVQPRAKTFRDALSASAFALRADDAPDFDAAAVEKHLRTNNGEGARLLGSFRSLLGTLPSWDAGAIQFALDAFAKSNNLPNPGPIAQPLRVAVAGVAVTPGIAETLGVLGRDATLARIDRLLGG